MSFSTCTYHVSAICKFWQFGIWKRKSFIQILGIKNIKIQIFFNKQSENSRVNQLARCHASAHPWIENFPSWSIFSRNWAVFSRLDNSTRLWSSTAENSDIFKVVNCPFRARKFKRAGTLINAHLGTKLSWILAFLKLNLSTLLKKYKINFSKSKNKFRKLWYLSI